MADKLLNPFSDESKYSTEDLEKFTSKYYVSLWSNVPKGMQVDSAAHYLQLASDELKRRRAILESPDKEEEINEKYNKRTTEIQEGNEYRKRNNLNTFGEHGDKFHPFNQHIGSRQYDHDISAKGLRKAKEATANWLRKLRGEEPIKRDISQDPYRGEALISQAKRKALEEKFVKPLEDKSGEKRWEVVVESPKEETTAEFLERIIKTRR